MGMEGQYKEYTVKIRESANAVGEAFLIDVPVTESISDVEDSVASAGILYTACKEGSNKYGLTVDEIELMNMILGTGARKAVAILEYLRLDRGWRWHYKKEVGRVIELK